MTLEDLLKTCEGNAVLTVATSKREYCHQEKFDIFVLPEWVESEKEKKDLIKAYQMALQKEIIIVLEEMRWWKEVKDKKVIRWCPLGGGRDQREIWVSLSEVSE